MAFIKWLRQLMGGSHLGSVSEQCGKCKRHVTMPVEYVETTNVYQTKCPWCGDVSEGKA